MMRKSQKKKMEKNMPAGNRAKLLKSGKSAALISTLMLSLFLQMSCSQVSTSPVRQKQVDNLTILQNSIDKILQDSVLHRTRTGIKIVSLDRGEVLYSRDSQLLFHPASNMKLLTTATALKKLGPDYRFRNMVFADSFSITNGGISGNLYMKGFGNPDLVTDDLEKIAANLAEKGIRFIEGNLVCDDSYFDDLFWGSGWMWDDASAWYWAPITPLTVNDNCIELKIRPGKKLGDTVLVDMMPQTDYMGIVNKAVTVDSTDTLLLEKFKVEREWKHPQNMIVVEGGFLYTDSLDTYLIDVVDGTLYTGTLFYEILKRKGISLAGEVVRDTVPDTAVKLIEHGSLPLSLIVYNTNKISDNLSAELILKTLGAEFKNPPGTAKKGITIINDYLHTLGIDTAAIKLADGSGVSRYNLVTADLLIELLKDMDKDFRVQAEFKTSLPIASIDGTLKNRMKNTAAADKLRAKTGTLSGVSALSGYTVTADGERIAFSMIMEHFVGSSSKIRKIQDKVGSVISGFSRTSTIFNPVSE
ncbi:MAG: D-alanyl-D-alanine carboxypeptidase/D-alanyl-D-alanine-endopeptidase [Calditrichaeota bacterium]|nr:D-alanyl-D-alanine carboxypeptidase/D-alanyl-D-alanine-endopeptidase [Calditrichota bacterium]RQW02189.1 MAG: D-alanyl-D-alanine carboxypeptidase/D-alanyl-D-alanine-endopeptidase [Calditrichota bacterium]